MIKRHLLWTFERGSLQWDIMCLLILAFVFLLPRDTFEDIPPYMRVSASESVHTTLYRGNTVFTARLDTPVFIDTLQARTLAIRKVQGHLGLPVRAANFQPIRDRTGRLIAYAIWKEK
jgi:hypothetical protein